MSYLESKPEAEDSREAFLSDHPDNLPEEREAEADNAIQCLIRKQQVHSGWRLINALTENPNSPAVPDMKIRWDRMMVAKSTKDEVENNIIDGVF